MRRALVAVCAAVAMTVAACGGTAAPSDNDPIADLPLAPDAIGEVAFGATPDEVLADLQDVLGGPSSDSEWLNDGSGVYGDCPTPLRVISWGSLTTFYSGGPEDGEFFAYSYGFDFEEALAGVDPRDLNLTTIDGIGVGSSVAALDALGARVVLDGDATIDVWTFVIDGDQAPHFRGQITGLDTTDTVLFLETSTGCE